MVDDIDLGVARQGLEVPPEQTLDTQHRQSCLPVAELCLRVQHAQGDLPTADDNREIVPCGAALTVCQSREVLSLIAELRGWDLREVEDVVDQDVVGGDQCARVSVDGEVAQRVSAGRIDCGAHQQDDGCPDDDSKPAK